MSLLPTQPEPAELWAVVEVSARVDQEDVERAARRAALYRQAGYRAVATAGRMNLSQGGHEAATREEVVLMVDGRVQGWEEALE